MPSALIIGASRGIGREMVNQYLADGWKVHATARDDQSIEDLQQAGASAHRADTTDRQSLDNLAGALDGEVDLVVVNAGINRNDMEQTPDAIDPGEWTKVMQVNALGPLQAASAVGGKIAKGGTLAVVSSKMGSIADNQMGGFYSYRMSKAALNAGLKSLSMQMEPQGVGTIALHPGWVKTDMGGDQAPVTPAQSVTGMKKVLDQKSAGDGRLFVDFEGNELSW
ncbi:MAG: SDR family oxidoreductase [Pacificimonas sp.]